MDMPPVEASKPTVIKALSADGKVNDYMLTLYGYRREWYYKDGEKWILDSSSGAYLRKRQTPMYL